LDVIIVNQILYTLNVYAVSIVGDKVGNKVGEPAEPWPTRLFVHKVLRIQGVIFDVSSVYSNMQSTSAEHISDEKIANFLLTIVWLFFYNNVVLNREGVNP